MKLKSLFPLLALIVFGAPSVTNAQQGLDTLSLKSIFYEPLLAGHRPSLASFSPDGKRIFYQANDSAMAKSELFSVDLKGKNRKRETGDFPRGFNTSPDKKWIAYTEKGDLWLADTNFEHKRKLISSKKFEYNAHWSPDSDRLAFVQNGDVWIINIKNSQLMQVTQKEEKDPSYYISSWAGPDKLILSQSDNSGDRTYYFPEYVHKYVQTGASKRGIPVQILSVAYLDSNKVQLMFEGKEYVRSSVSATGRYLAVDRIDAPMKHRTITVFDLQQPKSTKVFADSTKGWLSGTDMEFAPEGDLLMFRSEQDGWNHIYTVNPDGSNLKQHTHGSFEVPWAEWLDGSHVVFASTKVDPGERQLYTINLNNDKVTTLTTKTGFRDSFRLSPDRRTVVYRYTYFNVPFELYSLDLKKPKEIRLTHTIPDRFKAIDWQKEDYIRFTGRDGTTKLSMSVLKPVNKNKTGKRPVVVFVHGAGSLQNVYKGWSNSYYREYMFHQLLTEQGYYVMEVDYRHSLGYGRKFREDVTNWMGHYETQDIEDGINYLAKHYPQADTSRVGIYGGSYGGFMSLYAISVAPEYFDAAAALRAVTNWENYYHTNPWYTLPRLGTPKADSVNYARSSPITYVDQLKRPVLILHGLMDNNVGFQDAAEYIDKLIKTGGKDFDMMMYPTERHSFKDPDAWYDEYSRINRFFNERLKNN